MKMTYQTGLAGEQIAAAWLNKNAGMTLLASRVRTKAGEIDLIMTDGETVVFVEVKTRLGGRPGDGLMAVDRKKQQRIARAATLWLMGRGWLNRQARFDVTEVTGERVIHIPNAFQPGGMFFG